MPRHAEQILLLVDQSPTALRNVEPLLARHGWELLRAPDAPQALALLASRWARPVYLALVGNPEGQDMAEAVTALRSYQPRLPILALGDRTGLQGLFDAVRAGADDFFFQPVVPTRLLECLIRDPATPAPPAEKITDTPGLDDLVGTAFAFRGAVTLAVRAARTTRPLLIRGEKGVGKEALARAIHAASSQTRGPMLVLNCRDIPAGLAESELMGHVCGAFPGAFDDRLGALVRGAGGTLLLDEIEALPPPAQAMLIRALASGEVRPLGGSNALPLQARIIAATDLDLPTLTARGGFREDLLAQLQTIDIQLPPLRQRIDDLPALARHLLARLEPLAGLVPPRLDPRALEQLAAHGWPGNVRELQGILLRAALVAPNGVIAPDHLHLPPAREDSMVAAGRPRLVVPATGGVSLYTHDGHLRPLDAIEADIIRLAIGHYHGRMSEAARRLGIGRSTLYRKLDELGIGDVA